MSNANTAQSTTEVRFEVYFNAVPQGTPMAVLSNQASARRINANLHVLPVVIIEGYTEPTRECFQRLVETNTTGLVDIDLLFAIPVGDDNGLEPVVFKDIPSSFTQ